MTDSVRIEIPGTPVPWARAGKQGKRHYTKAPQAAHMATIQDSWVAAGRPKLRGPVVISAQFWLPRPRSHYGVGHNSGRLRPSAPLLPTAKPDLSNLIKIVEDALNSLLWVDDAHIVCISGLHKHYAEQPGQARTELVAWPSRQ